MHYQHAPHGEVKVVRCVKGALHDVIIDLRPDSPTYRKWEGFDLTAENGRMLYVPAGFAHGFQTLEDDTHATYQVSYPYTPGAEGGVRWDDPAFGDPLAAAGQRDLGQGRGLAAARGLSPRRRRGSARSHVGTAAKTLNRLSFQHRRSGARPGRSAAQLVAEIWSPSRSASWVMV